MGSTKFFSLNLPIFFFSYIFDNYKYLKFNKLKILIQHNVGLYIDKT